MLVWLEQFLVRYPELALFLVIAAGYWIGSFKIRAFSLGPVTGALFAGLLVGQFAHVPVSAMTKSFLFLLFLFGIGYSVGPQFMQAMKRDGLKPVLVALVVCFTGLAAAIFIAKALRLDPGFSAGLMSGSLTQSSAMGTATDAINALPLPQADRARFVAHIAVADAVCYIFGYAGVIVFLSMIAPALLKIDLRTEALKLEQSLGMTRAKPGAGIRLAEIRGARLSVASRIAARRRECCGCRGAGVRGPVVHPPDPPRRPHHRSGARHNHRDGRRAGALRPASGHRRADRTSRGGVGGPRAARCPCQGRRRHPAQSEARGHNA